MEGAHIAVITLPHSPHVFPMLPIVSALMRRKYRVTVATSDRFAKAVNDVGAELVRCPPLELSSQAETPSHEHDSEDHPFVDFTERTLGAISAFYEANPPDLILYDFMAFSGRVLTKRMGTPAIQTSPFYALHDDHMELQVRHESFRRTLVDGGSAVSDYLARYGIDSKNFRTDKEKLNLYLFPRALQPNAHLFEDNCYFAGRCAAERVAHGSWDDCSDGRPIALVATSTIHAIFSTAAPVPAHFRVCVDALTKSGWHVVLSIGEKVDLGDLLPLPAHCQAVSHSAYLNVLPHARLLFFSSGIISTSEAAYHGVPMVAISNHVAEFEWQADHLEELGIGIHLRDEALNVENVRRIAHHLTTAPEVVRRVYEMREHIRKEPGAEEAAARVDRYLQDSLQASN